MNDLQQLKEQYGEDAIIKKLPSGATLVITGSPSVENCRIFLRILLKANSKSKESST